MSNHKVYRLLLSKKLGGGNKDHEVFSIELDKLSLIQLGELCDSVSKSLPRSLDTSYTPFSFIGNSSLAGGPQPCSSLRCRLKIVDDLARFASLYADQVSIPDPFQWLSSSIPYFTKEYIIYELSNYIFILWHLKALLENNIIYFVDYKHLHVCNNCYPGALANANPSSSINSKSIQKYLHNKILKEVTYTVTKFGDNPCIEIRGPENLVPHGRAYFNPRSLETMKLENIGSTPRKLTKKEISNSGLLHMESDEIMYDLQRQDSYSHRQKLNYLTQRPIDYELLQIDGKTKATKLNPSISPTPFAHMLPIIDKVSVSKILKVRNAEKPAFELYREAVSKSLKGATNLTEIQQADMFNDTIRPEINKIENSIRNSKKILWSSIAQDTVLSSGSIAIGAFGAFLHSHVGLGLEAIGVRGHDRICLKTRVRHAASAPGRSDIARTG